MNSNLAQMQFLGTIGNVLTVLVLLIGLIVVIVSYTKGKSKVALLGSIGLLLLFLFSCCSTTWGFADAPLLKAIQRQATRGTRNYFVLRNIGLFLLRILELGGLGVLIAAILTGSKKD